MNRRSFIASLASIPAAISLTGVAAAAGKKYKACIIGDTKNGGYGHSLHLVWALQENVEVVALADPDDAGRAKMAAEAKAPRTYVDYREMLDKEKPNLVSIGPRFTDRHKEYVLACVNAGCHGILEKPIALDLAEADEMVAAAANKNLKWSIAHNFRASPVVQHLKKAIMEDGLIGQVLEMRARGKEDHRAGGEDLIVLGTHIFDLMIFMAGKPNWCSADFQVDGRPATPADVHSATEPLGPVVGNQLAAIYGFSNGVMGYFSSQKNDQPAVRWGIDIYGSKGVVSVRADVVPKIVYLADPSWSGRNTAWQPIPGAPDVVVKEEPLERNLPIIVDLLDAIGRNREPAYSIASGRDAYEMIQGAFESCATKGRVSFPISERSHPLKRWA